MTSTVHALLLAVFMAVLPPGGSFVDDDGNVHEGGIEAIAAEGITRGCNPPANDRYCPEKTVTRGQMAVFLARALDLGPTSNDYFIDDETSLFEAGINRLAAAGITQGCNPPANNRFCPDQDMTRGQMAAMLARAFNYPVSHHNRFNDDNGHIFEQAIQKIAAAGVTVGCNPPANNRFCPNDPIRRDQMATLLTRANHLTPNRPPGRCPTLPADDIWNTPIDHLPVHPRSAQYVSSIGSSAHLHPDFGSGVWPPGSNSPIGIPYVEVPAGTPAVTVTYTAYGGESDPGPFPIPAGRSDRRRARFVGRSPCHRRRPLSMRALRAIRCPSGTGFILASGLWSPVSARFVSTSPGWLDFGRRRRPTDLSGSGSLRRSRLRTHRSRHQIHGAANAIGARLARPPRRLEFVQPGPAGDGAEVSPLGPVRHLGFLTSGAGDPASLQGVRDHPRRQWLPVVHIREPAPQVGQRPVA